jgi:hypothetical protein
MKRLALLALLALGACAAPSKAVRVQEVATELNMGLRFGRIELAVDKVARDERANFIKRHQAWGGAVRIVDLEMSGLTFRESGEADVFLSVNWQRTSGMDSLSTVIHQEWKDFKGTWMLVKEERSQGDAGLLGDVAAPSPADETPSRAARGEMQYRTTVIR